MSNRRHVRAATVPRPTGRGNPQVDNGGRWHHIASESEVARAMSDPQADVCEWEALGQTFVASLRHLTIVRTSAMGGDTFDIECAWVYPNSIALMLDAAEIKHVARNSSRG